MLDDILDWVFSLIMNPDWATPHPFTDDEKEKTNDPIKTIQEPPNVVYTRGEINGTPFVRAFTQTNTKDGGFEADIYANGHNIIRDGMLGHLDKKTLSERKLNIEVAKILKPYWASEKTAKETSTIFKNKRGYGIRTVEKYWACFNTSIKK